jgi:hypothetical protein
MSSRMSARSLSICSSLSVKAPASASTRTLHPFEAPFSPNQGSRDATSGLVVFAT